MLSFVLGRFCSWKRFVTPFDSEEVIGTDDGDEVGAVAGLGDIIEPAVIHDGGFGAELAGEFRIAELFNGVSGAALHVMWKAEGMADLMRDNVGEQFSEEIVGDGEFL